MGSKSKWGSAEASGMNIQSSDVPEKWLSVPPQSVGEDLVRPRSHIQS